MAKTIECRFYVTKNGDFFPNFRNNSGHLLQLNSTDIRVVPSLSESISELLSRKIDLSSLELWVVGKNNPRIKNGSLRVVLAEILSSGTLIPVVSEHDRALMLNDLINQFSERQRVSDNKLK